MNDTSAHMERSRGSSGGRSREGTEEIRQPATWERVDRVLEVRARLVVALDAIEDRNPGLAELCLLELLDDLDGAEQILGTSKRAA
jgi:hypothetical protein